jgi:SAM-dependent methyltransferase
VKIATTAKRIMKPRGKSAFIGSLPFNAKVFDVGCGNDSPMLFKRVRPNAHYTGIDVAEYRHSVPIMADEYITSTPEGFVEDIAKFKSVFDAVISSHNLEHCFDREATLAAMASALKPGGKIYISFPSEKSKFFPSRQGTLNYMDDDTHVGDPPDFVKVKNVLREQAVTIDFAEARYRPLIPVAVGAIMEPLSAVQRKVKFGTWALYGFETIVWGTRTT